MKDESSAFRLNGRKLVTLTLIIVALIFNACSGESDPQPTTEGEAPAAAEPATDGVAADPAVNEVETAVVAETADAEGFELEFVTANDQRLSTISLDLVGLEAAPDGKTYAVWLIDNQGQNVLLGPATAGQTFTYADPAGDNLVGKTIGAALSLEAPANVEASGLAAPTEVRYAGQIPADIVAHVQTLVVSAPDTPGNTPYDPGLRDQAELAATHGQLALDAITKGDLASGRLHVEHVWNILSGQTSPDFGDLDGDGEAQNPGDGYGVSVYALKVAEISDQIAEIPGLDAHIREAAAGMAVCARDIAEVGFPQARDQGQLILGAADAAAAEPAGLAMVDALNALAAGVDANGNGEIEAVKGECGATQVYELSHELFHIHLTPQSSLAGITQPAAAAQPAAATDAVVLASAGDIAAVVQEYGHLLGSVDNGGVPGHQPTGFRSINWDGVPDELAAPNFLPGDFFNAAEAPRARGAVFSTPGAGVQVSADSDNPSGSLVRFGHLNPTYVEIFQAFSEERLFSPIGSNIVDLTFFVPGTTTPAVVTGFGAVYTDVDLPHTAFEYFDADGNSLGQFEVPVADNGLSFLGVVFPEPVVYRVRIQYGTVALGPNDGEGVDVSVMDDFIYGEPQPISELSESSAPVTAGAETIDIAIADNSFTPPTITVPVGTTLVWTHGGQRQHTVTAESGDFNSGTLEQNATFQHTFDQPGVYPYFCEIHGGAGGAGMSAVITVGEG